jgi:hypothetical protein
MPRQTARHNGVLSGRRRLYPGGFSARFGATDGVPSQAAGQASSVKRSRNLAMLALLLQSCVLHEIEPQSYIADVLLRVQDHPAARIDELVPASSNESEQAVEAPVGRVAVEGERRDLHLVVLVGAESGQVWVRTRT